MSRYFLPLAEKIAEAQTLHNGTFYLAINGCQGSGKSTLSAFLGEWFSVNGMKVAVLSLDDFYHDRKTRRELAERISPLLAIRGVPGTHDSELMAKTLTGLKAPGSMSIPRFNKATDNPFPSSDWPKINGPVDLVIMEGWCWGVSPQSKLQLRYPVNALEAEQDANLVWRNWVNQQITELYQPLYSLMDFWVMLKAPGFDNVFQWRLEQEQKLSTKINSANNSRVMNEAEVLQFIQFYQRLTEECLRSLPQSCDVVLELDNLRNIHRTFGL